MQGDGADRPFGAKETEWLSVRFRPGEGSEVRFLRWYAADDDCLMMLVAEDDPILVHARSGASVQVAPVRARGLSPALRTYAPATLEVLGPEEAERVGSMLNAKYGIRRRIYRAGSWVVRRLDRSHGLADVVVRFRVSAGGGGPKT